jgi:hypothetical protein
MMYILVLLTVSGALLSDGGAAPALPPAVYAQDAAVCPGPADGIWGVLGGRDAILVLPPACVCSGC